MADVIIQTQNLCKHYKQGEAALEDVSLEIYAGEIFGIIGKSGAGKSTLVRCMNYLERPTSGEVLFCGEALSGMTNHALYTMRQRIGMVFQHFNLLMQRNILDNICFPLEIAGWKHSHARARAFELLDVVKLTDKAKAYPATLSGGQQQRVAIARAIAAKPDALLCDEATSALDIETTGEILTLLCSINKNFGITIVVITHEIRVVEELCDRVAVLNKSRVAEVGPVKNVFSNPQSQAAKILLQNENDSITRLARLLAERGLTAEEVLARV